MFFGGKKESIGLRRMATDAIHLELLINQYMDAEVKATKSGQEHKSIYFARGKIEVLIKLLRYSPFLPSDKNFVKAKYMECVELAIADMKKFVVPARLVQHLLNHFLAHPAMTAAEKNILNDMLTQYKNNLKFIYETVPKKVDYNKKQHLVLSKELGDKNLPMKIFADPINQERFEADWNNIISEECKFFKCALFAIPKQVGPAKPPSQPVKKASPLPSASNSTVVTSSKHPFTVSTSGIFKPLTSAVSRKIWGQKPQAGDLKNSKFKGDWKVLKSIYASEADKPDEECKKVTEPTRVELIVTKIQSHICASKKTSVLTLAPSVPSKHKHFNLDASAESGFAGIIEGLPLINETNICNSCVKEMLDMVDTTLAPVPTHGLVLGPDEENAMSKRSEARAEIPYYLQFETKHGGMSGMGIWLKSLDLEKYLYVFKHMKYIDMLSMTTAILMQKKVPKDDAKKLSSKIQGLHHRPRIIKALKHKMQKKKVDLESLVEEILTIAFTPMRPISSVLINPNECNIAFEFFEVLIIMSNLILKKLKADMVGYINMMSKYLWMLGCETFKTNFGDLRFQLAKVKIELLKLKNGMLFISGKIRLSNMTAEGAAYSAEYEESAFWLNHIGAETTETTEPKKRTLEISLCPSGCGQLN